MFCVNAGCSSVVEYCVSNAKVVSSILTSRYFSVVLEERQNK